MFAVMCAGLFPVIHMGRPWLAFWMLPYPNSRGSLWINFRSPLIWDFFAISTYLTISAIFWYIGLLPDLATIRDRTRNDVVSGFSRTRARLFSWLSLGWNASYSVWHRYEVVYLLLAGLATPLVLSVHTIVSMDFATAVVPGWHTTIFPPYFVAGAIFSGMAMVLTLMLVARKTMRLEDYITHRHVDAMCKLIILTSGMVGLAYATEFFIAFYSGNRYEQFAFINRATGPLAWGYWIMVGCNVLVPQLFWFPRVRRTLPVVFIISLLINVGMWFERFIIIVSSLERDFLPSSWASYSPTSIEIATLVGSFGLFFTCFLLFCRFVPVIAIAEIKAVLHPAHARRTVRAHDSYSGSTSDARPTREPRERRPLPDRRLRARGRSSSRDSSGAQGRAAHRRRVRAARSSRPRSRHGPSAIAAAVGVLRAWPAGRRVDSLVPVLGNSRELADQCGRQTLEFAAGFHSRHVRSHGALRRRGHGRGLHLVVGIAARSSVDALRSARHRRSLRARDRSDGRAFDRASAEKLLSQFHPVAVVERDIERGISGEGAD